MAETAHTHNKHEGDVCGRVLWGEGCAYLCASVCVPVCVCVLAVCLLQMLAIFCGKR